MNFILAGLKSINSLVAALFLQFTVLITVFLDIPVARQIICFAYFTFVPGLIIIKLLRLNEFSVLETLLFSVGFSVAFLMLIGLFLNEFLFALGFSNPLSLLPLMITLNIFMLVGGVLACLRGESIQLWKVKNSKKVLLIVLPLIALPILSILGAMWVNIYGNNVLLLLMLVIIPILFVIGIISRKLLPSWFYPLAIVMIAIALLFHSSLISRYWVPFGSDTPGEYTVFKTTENNAHWGQMYGRFNSMLSITILPTVYSVLLNLDATYVIKALYPLLFAIVPLALYCLWRSNFGDKRAFAAAFLLMAASIFYMEMLGLARQMVAELFLVLLLLVILSEKMKSFNKVSCFIIFSFALVTSHYDLAEIFLFFIFTVWILLIAMKRLSRNITITMIMSFWVIAFSWYLFTSGSAVFESVVYYGNYVIESLGQFLNPASRGATVLTGLGLTSSPSFWNSVSRVFAYLTEFFIVVGFIGLITRRKKVLLKREYFMLTGMAMVLLVALIAVPALANTMNMSRFYHILLFFLAPLCVLGVENSAKLILKGRTAFGASVLLLIVLVPYFLFQTNFMYEVAGAQSWSLPLSKYRMTDIFLRQEIGYFDESEVVGALWLSKNVNVGSSDIYADAASAGIVLGGDGMIPDDHMEVLSNVTALSANATVYLDRANLVDDVGAGPYGFWNTTSISHILDFANNVYSNGGCEIYKNAIDSQTPTQ